ncbi:MAG: hypothetical protein IKZ13_01100 [Akkermansia sp.]|nr:hypothetical protein [Akkermansia sp.]
MAEDKVSGTSRGTLVLRLVAAVLLLSMCVFKLFLTYRGMDQPVAMDQAQIARSVAQGNGFSTKFLRPIEVVKKGQAASAQNPLNLEKFADTNHAPLNIVAMAVALKLTGYDDFDAKRITDSGHSYAGDRVIAATTTIFFAIAMVLAYLLVARLFDEVVAASTVIFMVLSDLLLQYSVSGLPQPLMMCCLLVALHALLTAFRCYNSQDRDWAMLYVGLAFVAMGLLCLSGWMGVWLAVGLLIFCCMYFRPAGAYALIGAIVVGLIVAWPLMRNNSETGSILGNAMLGLYNSFGGGEEMAQRAANLNNAPLQGKGFVLNFLGYTFGQLRGLYVNMGSILVVPFFFLAIFNRYRRDEVQALKWAVFCMWVFACIGMALFGIESPMNGSQLAVLFTPVFAAYGLSLVFNLLARNRVEGATFNQMRGLTIFLMVLVSAGPFLSTLPKDLYMGIWLGNKSRPQYPPYYPPALNNGLVDVTNPRDVVVTDQPWAVAWYANRKALWMPTSTDDYVSFIEPAIQKSEAQIQGFLITPSSHSAITTEVTGEPGGMSGIISNMGDFAPLAMEGKILQMVPRRNVALADFFIENVSASSTAQPLGQIVSSRGTFSKRVPLLGSDIMYYCRPEAGGR